MIPINIWFNSGFGKDPTTSKYEIYAKVDQLSLIGKYKVKGNVIILPVVGSGPANLTFGKHGIDSSLNIHPISYFTPSENHNHQHIFILILILGYPFVLADNVDVSIKFIPKVEIKKGKQYLTFTDVKLDFTTTR